MSQFFGCKLLGAKKSILKFDTKFQMLMSRMFLLYVGIRLQILEIQSFCRKQPMFLKEIKHLFLKEIQPMFLKEIKLLFLKEIKLLFLKEIQPMFLKEIKHVTISPFLAANFFSGQKFQKIFKYFIQDFKC